MFGGNRYYVKSLHLGVDTSNDNRQFKPYIIETDGYTNRVIAKLRLGSNNSNYEAFGPGSKLQIWDCGPIS